MSKMLKVSVNGALVADQVTLCADSQSRSRGLLGRSELGAAEGVLMVMPAIAPYLPRFMTSIHMIGMKFSIAVVFLDARGAVINAALAHPGQLKFPRRGAASILEVHPTHLDRFPPGAVVTWQEA